MRRPVGPILLLWATALLLANPGCQNSVVTNATWPWMPSQVELHGLSRFMLDADEELLSLRVLFTDGEGDPTKFPGLVTFTIIPESNLDSQKRTIEFNLADPEVNQLHWDRVTMTYRFKLDLEWSQPPLPGTPIRVRVLATLPGGAVFSSGITLRREG